MNNYEAIQVTENGPVLTVGMNRPAKANAMNDQMSREIVEVLQRIRERSDLKYVVFTGNGQFFSGGADMNEAAENLGQAADPATFMRIDQAGRQDFMKLLDETSQITIAAINGPMYGAAFAMAMACDFRIMADVATACLPETQRGMFFTAGCTPRLVHLVGSAKAKELIMLGEPIDAEEALRIGLVSRVVKEESLFEEVERIITLLDKSPMPALQVTKKLINSMIPTGGSILSVESELLELLMMKSDLSGLMGGFKR